MCVVICRWWFGGGNDAALGRGKLLWARAHCDLLLPHPWAYPKATGLTHYFFYCEGAGDFVMVTITRNYP